MDPCTRGTVPTHLPDLTNRARDTLKAQVKRQKELHTLVTHHSVCGQTDSMFCGDGIAWVEQCAAWNAPEHSNVLQGHLRRSIFTWGMKESKKEMHKPSFMQEQTFNIHAMQPGKKKNHDLTPNTRKATMWFVGVGSLHTFHLRLLYDTLANPQLKLCAGRWLLNKIDQRISEGVAKNLQSAMRTPSVARS